MTDSPYVDGYPTPTPLMKRLEDLSRQVSAEVAAQQARLVKISRGLAAAEIVNLVPNAVTLCWEKTTSPGYHSDEYDAPELYLEAVLDAENNPITLEGDVQDWVSDALTENQDNLGINLWELRDGATGSINLLNAIADAENI